MRSFINLEQQKCPGISCKAEFCIVEANKARNSKNTFDEVYLKIQRKVK